MLAQDSNGQVEEKKQLPVLIIGAGISGLLLAQVLRKSGIPFEVFERDEDFTTRGPGWGMTLHWSLPALRECLPDDLFNRIPSTYVDRAAIERGEKTAFPFFDLSTGELKHEAPRLGETQRIRVSRQRLRALLAEQIDVQWGKAFRDLKEAADGVTVSFEDGSTRRGGLLVACDGSHSRVRRKLRPDNYANSPLPIRLFGFTMRKRADEANVMRDLDPFVVHGTSGRDNSSMFLSMLDGPGESSNGYAKDKYVYSVCISRRIREDEKATDHKTLPINNDLRIAAVTEIIKGWAEPFCSFVRSSLPGTEIKQLDLDDYLPPVFMANPGIRAVLMGDSLHTMSMYRGEGANHAIVDVLDFKEKVLPQLGTDSKALGQALRWFEEEVAGRTRPAVLASRQACLDAHDWERLMDTERTPSPLLTRRAMRPPNY